MTLWDWDEIMPSAHDRLPLGALRVFEAVATHLSFSEAAASLHVTPAAVSQQIKTLESYLQVPLFRRNGRSVEITEEGLELLPANPVFSAQMPRRGTAVPYLARRNPRRDPFRARKLSESALREVAR